MRSRFEATPRPVFFTPDCSSVAPVHGDHGCAAEAEVVLQCDPCALDLAIFRLAAKMPNQLGALRETGRPEWMPFRK
jgi:hypothetical protein